MPRKNDTAVEPAAVPGRPTARRLTERLLPTVDSVPRDWSESGRRVPTGAKPRTKDEFADGRAWRSAPVVRQSIRENRS